MWTTIGKFGISGLGNSVLAAAFGLGFAAMAPAVALSGEADQAAASATAMGDADPSGVTDINAKAGVVDHIFQIGLSDKLEIKAAAETFVWGLSNRQSSAVWLMAPQGEQRKFGTRDAVYGFFSRVHPPLVHAKTTAFDSISAVDNVPIANIYVTDTAGMQWHASFAMARDTAGDWKIVGCRLVPAPGDLI